MAQRFPEELKIFGLSVHSNIAELAEQIKNHRPEIVCVSDPYAAREFVSQAEKLNVRLLSGGPGLEELAKREPAK